MIHYIGVYYKLDSDNLKNSSPAGVTKMHYIASKLYEISGGGVCIFSPGYSIEENANYCPSEEYVICDDVKVHEVATIGRKNAVLKILGFLFAHIQLLNYLFLEVKKKDVIVLYHSLFYKWEFTLFKLVKSNKVIIEVEELFSAAWGMTDMKSEIKYLSKFDGYIYVNDVMNQKFGFSKPYAVCYGNYDVRNNNNEKKDLHKLIYAGVLGKEESDVDVAMRIMDYLPADFSLDIAGYGDEDDIEYIKRVAEQKKNIKFEGYLSGEEYESFLCNGGIGLCTRVLPNHQSDFTFPSKILVYLTHGLIPVCPALDCLTHSKVASSLLFYEEATPQSIASKIESIERSGNAQLLLRQLDLDFGRSLCTLLHSCNFTK